MTKTQSPVLIAVRRRSCGDQLEVMVKKMGTPPKGSTIGNRARKVAAAEAGSVRRNWPSAWAEFIGLSRLKRIHDFDAKMLEVFFVSGCDRQAVDTGGCGDHGI